MALTPTDWILLRSKITQVSSAASPVPSGLEGTICTKSSPASSNTCTYVRMCAGQPRSFRYKGLVFGANLQDHEAGLHVGLAPLLCLRGVVLKAQDAGADHVQPINVNDVVAWLLRVVRAMAENLEPARSSDLWYDFPRYKRMAQACGAARTHSCARRGKSPHTRRGIPHSLSQNLEICCPKSHRDRTTTQQVCLETTNVIITTDGS